MCSVHVDIFTLVERQGTDVSTMRLFNAGATGGAGGATLKRANLAGKKAKEALNPKRMYEEVTEKKLEKLAISDRHFTS